MNNMQNTYQKVLVAIDFSSHSAEVVVKAKQLAEMHRAQLDMIHIVEVPVYPVLEDIAVMGMPGLWDQEVASRLTEESTKRLKQLADSNGINHYHVVVGLAYTDIVEYAKQKQVDLIVMGSHGASGLSRLIGSTTNAVINHAECDVLSVRLKED
jgi:universal stress protein A